MGKSVNQYNRIKKKWVLKVGCFIGFLYLPKKNLLIKKVTLMITNTKSCYKKMGSKAGCLAGFWHHCVMTMSARMHVYRYLLLDQKQVCEQSLYDNT